MKKKLLSSFMAVCMILTMLPTAAFAAASTAPTKAVLSNDNKTLTVTLAAAPVASDIINVYDSETSNTALKEFTISNTNTSQEITLDSAATGEVYVTFTSVATQDATESTRVVSTGYVAPTYAVTITVNKDGSEWTNHGKTITLQKDSEQAIGLTSVPDGTYKILVDTVDTGETVVVNGADKTATLEYYTVAFDVKDASDASGSTIAATYGGAKINSNDVVLGGKELVITATGAGASSYTYAWTGDGTKGETTAALTISNLSAAVNATCTVTGTAAPTTYAVTITVNKDGTAWSDHTKTITLQKGSEQAITNLNSVPNGTYKILVDGADTGKTVVVNGAAATATLDYYTVAFAVTDASGGTSTGSSIAATYGGNAITSGNVVLGGKELVITATGAGASTYTYAWTGDGTKGETTAALTISNLSAAVNATCTVTGTAAPTYAVTITVKKDGAAWSDHGKAITLKKGTDSAITDLTSVPNGTYNIWFDGADTGKTVVVNGAAATATLEYYTVAFAVTDASGGTSTGSSIAATYGGNAITSGDVVLGGKELVITATGAGASTYTFAWTGDGTNKQTTAALTISNLGAKVNASCAVTGTAAPSTTYAVTITVNKDGAAWSDHGKAITLQKGSEQAITNLNSVPNGTYNIWFDGADTGKTVVVNGAAATATLNYYTVTFAVTDVSPASGSTIAATYDSNAITSGNVVLGGKKLVITATGAGASTYTYAWTGDGTNNETIAVLTISNLSAKVNASCAVTGTGTATPPTTYAVTITMNKDGTAWANHGKTITLQKDSESAIGLTNVPNGTYKILVDNVDTGKTVVVNGADKTETLDYYTVAFAVTNASDASGSTIAATYGGASATIQSGDVVLGGKELVITATGAGASTYTYAWTGDGTNNETIAVLTISNLGAKVNATCTVTGTGTVTPSVAAKIETESTIANGATGVTVTVTSDKVFDTTNGKVKTNWTVTPGTTGLTLDSVALDSTDSANKTATLTFTGTAAEGTLKIKAAVAAFAAGVTAVSNEISVNVPAAVAPPTEDKTAPVLSATSASDITATGATLNFTSDEAGTYYYLVLAAADAAPTAATIKAQGTAVAKGTDTATASANTATVTGLTAATAYKAYVVVEDSAANISDVASIAITTAAAPSPFSIESIGAASTGGVGMKRTIAVKGPFTGKQYLVVQHTEGSGETAKVTATCIQLHEGTTTVEVSSQTTSVVRALITSGMPNLTGTGDFGVTVYADKTSS